MTLTEAARDTARSLQKKDTANILDREGQPACLIRQYSH